MAKFQEVAKGPGLLLQEALDSARERPPGLILNRPRAVPHRGRQPPPCLAARCPGSCSELQFQDRLE